MLQRHVMSPVRILVWVENTDDARGNQRASVEKIFTHLV